MTRRHRRHSVALKRMIVEAYIDGEPLLALSKKHDVCRHLIRTWIEKYESGAFDDEDIRADLIPEYEAVSRRSSALSASRLDIEFLKGARTRTPQPRNGRMSVVTGPLASPSEEGASS